MSPCVVVICSMCVHSVSATSAAFRISATSCVVIVCFTISFVFMCVACCGNCGGSCSSGSSSSNRN